MKIHRFKTAMLHYIFALIAVFCTGEAYTQLNTEPIISLENGTLEKNVALGGIAENGLSATINLHYSSQSFRPQQQESEVGINWTLYKGGSITRIVNGIEDELRDDREYEYRHDHTMDYKDGYLVGIRKHKTSEENIVSLNPDNSLYSVVADTLVVGPVSDPFEIAPDRFQFEFPGISGEFYFDVGGEVVVNTDGPYSVQVITTGFSEQRAEPGMHNSCSPRSSSFLIRTENGYDYHFGGNSEYLEWYTFGRSVEGVSTRPVITTWNLNRVVSPAGKVMEYKYETVGTECNPNDDPVPSKRISANVVRGQYGFRDHYSYFRGNISYTTAAVYQYSGKSVSTCTPVTNLFYKLEKVSKVSLLKSIRIGRQFISFTYEKYSDSSRDRLSSVGRKLISSISINGTGIVPRKYNFTYDKKGGRNYRYFLTQVQEVTTEPFVFNYGKTDYFPAHNTLEINRQGVWIIGKDNILNRLGPGHPHPDATGNIRFCRFYENENGVPTVFPDYALVTNIYKSDYGLLDRITYPSKAVTRYTYQQGVPEATLISGKQYDGDKLVSSRTYTELQAVSLQGYPNYEYGYRKEVFADGSFTIRLIPMRTRLESEFISLYINPDRRDISCPYIVGTRDNVEGGCWNTSISQLKRLSRFTVDIEHARNESYMNSANHVFAILQFDKNGFPISKVINKRKSDVQSWTDIEMQRIPGIISLPKESHLTYNYVFHNAFMEEEATTYTLGQSFDLGSGSETDKIDKLIGNQYPGILKRESSIRYTYHPTFRNLTEEERTNSKGEIIRTRYTYPFSYTTAPTLVQEMKAKQIHVPIETKQYIVRGTSSVLRAANFTDYKRIRLNMFAPYQSYTWRRSPKAVAISGYPTQEQLLANNYEAGSRIVAYDETGLRPKQIIDPTGRSTCTIFDPINQIPLATIENITIRDLENIPFPAASPSKEEASTYKFENFMEVYKLSLSANFYLFEKWALYLSANYLPGETSITSNQIAHYQKLHMNHLQSYLEANFPDAVVTQQTFTSAGQRSVSTDIRGYSTYTTYDDRYHMESVRDEEQNIIHFQSTHTKNN